VKRLTVGLAHWLDHRVLRIEGELSNDRR
jgi:hypothetical protein